MNSLMHHLRGSKRASMPSVRTDEPARLRPTHRRSSSDPAQHHLHSVKTWLRRALPSSGSPSASGPRTNPPHAPSTRRRKRDFMRDALVRVFVKPQPVDREGLDTTAPSGSDRKQPSTTRTASVPFEDEPSDFSSVKASASGHADRSSDGSPPLLKAEDPVSGSEDDSEDESEGEEEQAPAVVAPPVQIPPKYHNQDRAGGSMVAGDVVLFTRRAFKRRLFLQGRRLASIPEDVRLDAVRVATVCNYGGVAPHARV